MLTNDRIVLKILKNNKKRPLSAYDVLDKFLRIKRVQPATVYRSLKNLMEQKLIHRLNQSKKYIVCNETHNENDVTTIVLCESCYEYEEININKKLTILDLLNDIDYRKLILSFINSNYFFIIYCKLSSIDFRNLE